MARPSFLIIIGILAILTPFSGLPIAFRSLFTAVLGVCVLGIGLSLRSRETHSIQSDSAPMRAPESESTGERTDEAPTQPDTPHASSIG